MTTSGTATTTFDFAEMAEEAYERCGKEMRTGYDLRTARRSLNLMLMDWANRGLNLWTIDNVVIPLVAGQAAYDLPVDTVSVLQTMYRTGSGESQAETHLARVSTVNYAALTNKNLTGRPVQVWIDRQGGQTDPTDGVRYPQAVLWPVPSNSSDSVVVWRLRRLQDAGDGGETQDVPFRFVPAMVAGLAYHLALKVAGADARIDLLKAQYDEAFQMAADEDREKSDLRVVPRMGR